MRLLVLVISVLCATCVGATCARAQTRQMEDQTLPYATHVDRRHGNDHVYPDRGAVIRDVPRSAAGVDYAGITYRFAGGVWYQRQGPAYLVVEPPIGVTVPQLPAFVTRFESGGKSYLYANDVFYRALPDSGGYEVVNDPADGVPDPSQTPLDVPPSRSASASPPPAQPAMPSEDVAVPADPTGLAISPRNGQSESQQAIDRYECYRYAVTQTSFDPLAPNGAAPPAEVVRNDRAYARAQAACLQGRGYDLP